MGSAPSPATMLAWTPPPLEPEPTPNDFALAIAAPSPKPTLRLRRPSLLRGELLRPSPPKLPAARALAEADDIDVAWEARLEHEGWAPWRVRQGYAHFCTDASEEYTTWKACCVTLLHDGALYLSGAPRAELAGLAAGEARLSGLLKCRPDSGAKGAPAYALALSGHRQGRHGRHDTRYSYPALSQPAQASGPEVVRLPLLGALAVPCPERHGLRCRHTFVIQTRSRDHYFRCDSAADARRWAALAGDAIAIAEARRAA